MTRLQADLAITGCAAIWGFAFLLQKGAVEHVGPATFVAGRLLLATAALAPLAWLELRHSAPAGSLRPMLGRAMLAGAALLGGMLFQQAGIASATVTNTGLLTGLYAVLTPLIATIALGRRTSVPVWIAAGLCVAGVPMLGSGSLGGFGAGDALVAICALFWAVHLLSLDAAVVQQRPVTFTAVHMGLAAIAACVMAAASEALDIAGILAAAPAIAYGGLLSNALTYAVLATAMRRTTAAEAGVLSSLEVVFATMAGTIVLGERLGAVGWAGAAFMVAAAVIVQASPNRQK